MNFSYSFFVVKNVYKKSVDKIIRKTYNYMFFEKWLLFWSDLL